MVEELTKMVMDTISKDHYIDDIMWNHEETVIQFEVFEIIDPTFSRGRESIKSRGTYRFIFSEWREEELGQSQHQQMKDWVEEEIETRFGEN